MADERYKIGIDFGGSHFGVGLTDSFGNIISKIDKNFDFSSMENQKEKEEAIIDTLIPIINDCIEEAKIDRTALDFIGVGAPGVCKGTKMIYLINIGIKNFDIGEALRNRYDELGLDEARVKIVVENDGNCAAVGEMELGALKGAKNGVHLVYGTGLGAGLILNGKLYKGEHNSAGEVGHVLDENRGHLETKVSVKRLRETVSDILNLKMTIDGIELEGIIDRVYDRVDYKIVERIQNKNSNVLELLNEKNSEEIKETYETYKDNLALSLINIVNTFDPKRISIGGSLSYFIEKDLDEIVRKVNEECYYKTEENPEGIAYEIVKAALGNDAGIIGAALLEKYIV